MTTLAEALPLEMARVRDEVMPAYLAIGDAGRVALILMRAELDRAAKALAEQDIEAMITCLQSLQKFTT